MSLNRFIFIAAMLLAVCSLQVFGVRRHQTDSNPLTQQVFDDQVSVDELNTDFADQFSVDELNTDFASDSDSFSDVAFANSVAAKKFSRVQMAKRPKSCGSGCTWTSDCRRYDSCPGDAWCNSGPCYKPQR